jgi:hypothetical protein
MKQYTITKSVNNSFNVNYGKSKIQNYFEIVSIKFYNYGFSKKYKVLKMNERLQF